MAKNKTGKRNTESPEGVRDSDEPKVTPKAPDGYQKQATDIVGFWDPKYSESVHFVPLEVKLFDSKIEPNKPSTIVVGRLVDAITLLAPGGEDDAVEGKTGDIIGVWYKPGMSALKNLAGVKVFMYMTGEVDTGKPNPMKTYDVLSKQKGAELHVTQDSRKKSRYVETPFAGARGDARQNAANPPEQGADDVPF
jgi:hypothetical protein